MSKVRKAFEQVLAVNSKTAMLSTIPIDLDKIKPEDIDKEILRLSIIAELDAVSLYEQMSARVQSERIKEVLLDVAKEEKTHVGEFQALLLELDPEHEAELEAGKKEVMKEATMNPRAAFERVLAGANKEYVIWGIPGKGVSGGGSEDILLAKYEGKPITDKNLAKKLVDVLESEYGCKKVRIQELDMSGEFDWMSDIGAKSRKAFEQALEKHAVVVASSLDGETVTDIRRTVLPQLEKAMLYLSDAMQLINRSGAVILDRAYQVVADEEGRRNTITWLSDEFKRIHDDCPKVQRKIAEAFDEVNGLKIDIKRAR